MVKNPAANFTYIYTLFRFFCRVEVPGAEVKQLVQRAPAKHAGDDQNSGKDRNYVIPWALHGSEQVNHGENDAGYNAKHLVN